MYLENFKITKNRDVIFMENDTSVGKTLEIHPSERNEGLTTVVVHESSKSYYYNDDEDREEQVGKDKIYPKRE